MEKVRQALKSKPVKITISFGCLVCALVLVMPYASLIENNSNMASALAASGMFMYLSVTNILDLFEKRK